MGVGMLHASCTKAHKIAQHIVVAAEHMPVAGRYYAVALGGHGMRLGNRRAVRIGLKTSRIL